ncbi:MAG: flagellar motor protein MotB [Deltaproteobacteria bacterium]|nr:flagellar motor protein MotB [Deltaproteobacteria bacterium]
MDIRDLLRKEEPDTEEGAPAWYVSFADMATLLMATFLMLLSFASLDLKKFHRMAGSVQTALGSERAKAAFAPPPSAPVLPELAPTPVAGKAQALAIVQGMFADLGSSAEIVEEEDGITVRFEGKVLFPSGSADFKPDARRVLDRVSELLRKYNFDLYILGHTDAVAIETSRFPSNWELSGARAAAALRHLVSQGAAPQRLVAVGLAESRPLASNATPEGRARNRRIEFLFKTPQALSTGGYKPAKP